MSLWNKIIEGLEQAIEVSSEKGTKYSHLIKLRWECRTIQKKIHHQMVELGSTIYELHPNPEVEKIKSETSDYVKEIIRLEKELKKKEEEIEELKSGIEQKHVRGLKKDLEMGDGTIEQIVVGEKSSLVGKKLSEIKLPGAVLIGSVVRNEEVIIPDGETQLHKGDRLTVLGKKDEVEKVVTSLNKN